MCVDDVLTDVLNRSLANRNDDVGGAGAGNWRGGRATAAGRPLCGRRAQSAVCVERPRWLPQSLEQPGQGERNNVINSIYSPHPTKKTTNHHFKSTSEHSLAPTCPKTRFPTSNNSPQLSKSSPIVIVVNKYHHRHAQHRNNQISSITTQQFLILS